MDAVAHDNYLSLHVYDRQQNPMRLLAIIHMRIWIIVVRHSVQCNLALSLQCLRPYKRTGVCEKNARRTFKNVDVLYPLSPICNVDGSSRPVRGRAKKTPDLANSCALRPQLCKRGIGVIANLYWQSILILGVFFANTGLKIKCFVKIHDIYIYIYICMYMYI